MNLQDSIPDTGTRFIAGRHGVLGRNSGQCDVVARCIRQYGEWAESELELLARLIEPGQSVLEFGGNYGAQTIYFAALVGNTGQVHVAEPERLAFQRLCANVANNDLDNVHAHQVWLTQVAGKVAHVADGPAGPMPCHIDAATIDGLRLPRLRLIKINVAGTLESVLAGALETLREDRPYLYFQQGQGDSAFAEIKAVKELGYRCWSHLTYLFNPDNTLGERSNLFPGQVLQNILALPSELQIDLHGVAGPSLTEV